MVGRKRKGSCLLISEVVRRNYSVALPTKVVRKIKFFSMVRKIKIFRNFSSGSKDKISKNFPKKKIPHENGRVARRKGNVKVVGEKMDEGGTKKS